MESTFSVDTGWWQFGYPAIPRVRSDDVKYAIMLVNPVETMAKSGFVVAWNVYAGRDDSQKVMGV